MTYKIIVAADDPERLAAFIVRLARFVARERVSVTLVAPDGTYEIARLDPLLVVPSEGGSAGDVAE